MRAGGGPQSRANRLAQAIQREEREQGLRPGSAMSIRSASPTGSADERDDLAAPARSARHQGQGQDQDPSQTSPVLEKALKAFTAAGSQAATSRARAKPTEPSRRPPGSARSDGPSKAGDLSSGGGGRGRRGAVGVQGESSRIRGTTQQETPSTPAFREMERVLAQVANDWPELVPPNSDDRLEDAGDKEDEGLFDPVTLALSLVDSQADPERFRLFLATKESLSRSLKSSIQTHYRSFDASVTSYNGLLSNLSFAQKNTTNLRTTLEEVRETLGKGRSELGVLEARRTELAEMDRILVTVEMLRNVPDRLENLMSEKRFLAAAVLLVRSLKTVSKGDITEIAATADLRAYFISQETVSLFYLSSLVLKLRHNFTSVS